MRCEFYEMFIAPYDMDAPWDPRGVPGTYRFLNRAWNLVQEFVDKNNDPSDSPEMDEKTTQELLRLTHLTIKKVTRDIEDEKFNTAVASMMEMVNGLYKIKNRMELTCRTSGDLH